MEDPYFGAGSWGEVMQLAKIQIMDEALANKIAAGEVVERPASVVKELLENAIDAGSKNIEIEVSEGGLAFIRVSDDGEGMDEEDLTRAFLRHATSKMLSERDLFRIRTLGFRGEALPSIAAVSKVEIASRIRDHLLATQLILEGGKVLEKKEVPHPHGTEIKVTDLFFNTPARLKYMRSIATENNHIQDVVNRIALAYPEISFQYFNEGREVLRTAGSGDMLSVIHAIYGLEVAKNMVPFQGEHLDFSVRGFLGKPELTRASRNYISFFVNGRMIRSTILQRAVLDGYHTLLPVNRYPFVILELSMDPSLVDVNVHPSKMEVRFSKEVELGNWLKEEIRKQLLHHSLIPGAIHSGKQKYQPTRQGKMEFSFEKREPANGLKLVSAMLGDQELNTIKNPFAQIEKEEWISTIGEERANLTGEERSISLVEGIEQPVGVEGAIQTEEQRAIPFTVYETVPDHNADQAPVHKIVEKTESHPRLPILEPLAQLHGTYILAQNEEGLYMVDQHAAQERINYERFRRELGKGVRSAQLLAIPYTYETTHSEAMIIRSAEPLLRELGIIQDSFGERTFIVREVPDWFIKGKEKEQIDEVIQLIVQGKGKISLADLRDKAAQLMACKASIKANQYLTKAEMESLLTQLCETENPFTCPHGRPILVHFSLYDIEKMFKRVM
jgi:DNA mismatch repair protein MutL